MAGKVTATGALHKNIKDAKVNKKSISVVR